MFEFIVYLGLEYLVGHLVEHFVGHLVCAFVGFPGGGLHWQSGESALMFGRVYRGQIVALRHGNVRLLRFRLSFAARHPIIVIGAVTLWNGSLGGMLLEIRGFVAALDFAFRTGNE